MKRLGGKPETISLEPGYESEETVSSSLLSQDGHKYREEIKVEVRGKLRELTLATFTF